MIIKNDEILKKINKDIHDTIGLRLEYRIDNDPFTSSLFSGREKYHDTSTWYQVLRLDNLTSTINDLIKIRDIIKEHTGIDC